MTTTQQASFTAQLVAGEKIEAGDLVAIDAKGMARVIIEPGQPGSKFRPMVQTEDKVVSNEQLAVIIPALGGEDDSGQITADVVRLTNGNTVGAFIADDMVQTVTFSPEGALLVSNVLGLVNGVHTAIAMAALKDGGCAIAYCESANAQLTATVLSADGTVTKESVDVPGVVEAVSLSMAALTDGGFVIAFASGDLSEPSFAVYDEQGDLIVPATEVAQFSHKVAHTQGVTVCPLENGKFAVSYGKSDGTSGWVYSIIYSNLGQRISDEMAIGDPLSLCPNGPYVTSVGLGQGVYAVGSYGGIGPGFQVVLRATNGSQIGSTIILDSMDDSERPNRLSLAALNNGNLGIAWVSVMYANGAVYRPDGVVVFPRANYGESKGAIALAAGPNGTGIVALQGKDGMLHVGQVDARLYGEISPTTIPAGNKDAKPFVIAVKDREEDKIRMALAGTASDMIRAGTYGSYTTSACTPVGLAVSNAEIKQQVTVQIAGHGKLRVPFKQPYAVDCRNNAIPGQKLSVIGNAVHLCGIQNGN